MNNYRLLDRDGVVLLGILSLNEEAARVITETHPDVCLEYSYDEVGGVKEFHLLIEEKGSGSSDS